MQDKRVRRTVRTVRGVLAIGWSGVEEELPAGTLVGDVEGDWGEFSFLASLDGGETWESYLADDDPRV